jgi:hypothetical protein
MEHELLGGVTAQRFYSFTHAGEYFVSCYTLMPPSVIPVSILCCTPFYKSHSEPITNGHILGCSLSCIDVISRHNGSQWTVSEI